MSAFVSLFVVFFICSLAGTTTEYGKTILISHFDHIQAFAMNFEENISSFIWYSFSSQWEIYWTIQCKGNDSLRFPPFIKLYIHLLFFNFIIFFCGATGSSVSSIFMTPQNRIIYSLLGYVNSGESNVMFFLMASRMSNNLRFCLLTLSFRVVRCMYLRYVPDLAS